MGKKSGFLIRQHCNNPKQFGEKKEEEKKPIFFVGEDGLGLSQPSMV
jgi:hypothetical protein